MYTLIGILQHYLLVQGETVDYDPWGKGLGAPQRDQSGNIRRYKHSDHAHIREFSPILESDRVLLDKMILSC